MKGLALALLFVCTSARAEVIPRPSSGDPRILIAAYEPDQVYVLRVASNTALAVELSSTEHIENIAIGTNAGWQVTPNRRGDQFFVKSSTESAPTNLIVVTDVRRYVFSMLPSDTAFALAPYVLRFTYPIADAAAATTPATKGLFRFSGSRALWPTTMTASGRSIRIIWAEDTPIPAIYSVDAANHESLVNGAMRDGVYVVDSVADRFVFRSGYHKARATWKRDEK